MTAPTTTSPARAPWLRAARWLLRAQVTIVAWLWITMAVVGAVVITLLNRFAAVELSIFQFSRHGALWTGFALAIILVTGTLAVHVANGLTRRAFFRATVAMAVVVGVAYAVLAAVGLQIEGAVYQANGWSHSAGLDDGSFDPGAGFVTTFPALALSFVAGQLSGLLVGMGYYRLGGWWGTLALPLTLAPIYLVGSRSLDTGQFLLLGPLNLSALVTAVVSVSVLALAALAYYLLVRDVPIRKVSS
ncbi:hypothetical protein FE374_06070 [Georgenia yuyongxinii]|uniref:Uncharacterized protein n=1 Tax=Georgenia yuyongxinii TaxID=2589797 RepID=A0A5B8C0K3_9MICO|nr:hypothetical protein [Georgenia yuyongxinii]QDC24249.1 hypothetical protein FE374_06070 [Georgenia yuyongxinii]